MYVSGFSVYRICDFRSASLSNKTFPLFYVYISPGFNLVSYVLCVIIKFSGDTSHLHMLTKTIADYLCEYHAQDCLVHMMYRQVT